MALRAVEVRGPTGGGGLAPSLQEPGPPPTNTLVPSLRLVVEPNRRVTFCCVVLAINQSPCCFIRRPCRKLGHLDLNADGAAGGAEQPAADGEQVGRRWAIRLLGGRAWARGSAGAQRLAPACCAKAPCATVCGMRLETPGSGVCSGSLRLPLHTTMRRSQRTGAPSMTSACYCCACYCGLATLHPPATAHATVTLQHHDEDDGDLAHANFAEKLSTHLPLPLCSTMRRTTATWRTG